MPHENAGIKVPHESAALFQHTVPTTGIKMRDRFLYRFTQVQPEVTSDTVNPGVVIAEDLVLNMFMPSYLHRKDFAIPHVLISYA